MLEVAQIQVVESNYDDIVSGRATVPEPIESSHEETAKGTTEDSTEET